MLLPSPGGIGTAMDLRVGQLVRVTFSAFATAPFAATEVAIQGTTAAEFDAMIVDTTSLPQRFVVRLEPTNPVACTFASNALVEDDATSIAEFFALFAGLRSGESIEVRLYGIVDGGGGLIAHRLEVDLDD